MQLDPHVLHLVVRWLHVAAMAVAFGGAVGVLAVSMRLGSRDEAADATLVEVAFRYEWLFWAAAGVLAMSGIGNLATFGTGLPVSGTDWGRTFLFKLGSVLVLAVLSLPRTLVVASLRDAAASPRVHARLRALYATTAGTFALILGFAVWLAHG